MIEMWRGADESVSKSPPMSIRQYRPNDARARKVNMSLDADSNGDDVDDDDDDDACC